MLSASADRQSTTDWSGVGPSGHAVQFYASDDELIPLLAGFVGTALVTGDAAVVLATKPHREALSACLAARGLALDIARRQGRLLEFDAAETLASMWTDGRIDTIKMRELATSSIQQARRATGRPRGRVAVFGELVALLWQMGYARTAVQVEEVWNDVQRDTEFSLACAYPMKGFGQPNDAAPFLRVCAQHSHVFPAQPGRARDHLSPLA